MLCANISPASGMVQRMVLPLAFDVFYITGSVLWTMREIILRVYHNQTSVCNIDDSVLWTVREIILRVYHNETSFLTCALLHVYVTGFLGFSFTIPTNKITIMGTFHLYVTHFYTSSIVEILIGYHDFLPNPRIYIYYKMLLIDVINEGTSCPAWNFI